LDRNRDVVEHAFGDVAARGKLGPRQFRARSVRARPFGAGEFRTGRVGARAQLRESSPIVWYFLRQRNRAFCNPKHVSEADFGWSPQQAVSPLRAALGPHQTGALEILKNLFQEPRRDALALGDVFDLRWAALVEKRNVEQGAEGVATFVRQFHVPTIGLPIGIVKNTPGACKARISAVFGRIFAAARGAARATALEGTSAPHFQSATLGAALDLNPARFVRAEVERVSAAAHALVEVAFGLGVVCSAAAGARFADSAFTHLSVRDAAARVGRRSRAPIDVALGAQLRAATADR
jgi:hypothetical protein